MTGRLREESGQMTVELAVAFPVLIIVAVIAVNALTFIAECAAFDRDAHDAVRTYAASPAYGQGPDQCCALVEQELRSSFARRQNLDISVTRRSVGIDHDEFTVSLEFYPSLFGRGLRSSVFGVSLPRLTHTTRYVVDSYKPGVVA